MSTFIHGIASAQNLDKSGEMVEIKGLDITSLAKTGIVNYEHKSDNPGQICGKILTAKKIFDQNDCSNEHESYFWNKCKTPFVYITAELLDDYCQSGKDAAGLFRYGQDNKDKLAILGFSVEGSEIPNTRKGMLITRSIARKVTLTASPCNSMCIAEILENQKPQVKDDFEDLFRSEANAIQMFKSDQGEKMYEQYLAKKEVEMTKSTKPSWSAGKVKGDTVHYTHPEHGTVSIQKQPTGDFHVKHQGKLAGLGGSKGTFNNAKQAGTHAKNYMQAVSNKKILAPKMHDRASPNMIGENKLHKALTAGGMNAAPSTLVDGSAYQTESLKSKKKTDWNKRAKEEYQNWSHREKFEKFMSQRMPHLAMGEIQAIGRTISLNKSLNFEKELSKLSKK